MLFSDLQKIVKGRVFINSDLEVRRFSTDTRTLSGTESEVFVASKGKRDGHDYISSAKEKGVKNFIVEKPMVIDECNVLVVENSIRALQAIAQHHREQFQLPVIGITGSNGKTTVKEWLSTILSEAYFVVKNPKSYNSQVGVPISIMEIQSNHEVGVFEAGISKVDEMKYLERMIQPDIGIFTTLGQAHDDGFTSLDQKLSEKLILFKRAKKIIMRSDAPYSKQIEQELNGKTLTWGLNGSGDVNVLWDQNKINVNGHTYDTDLIDSTQLENATHAILLAEQLGMSKESIQRGLNLIKPIPMRLELKMGINGCYVLDDSYNNDLAGLKVALDYLATHQQNEKRTLVLSDILQSGRSNEDLYLEVSALLKEKKIDRLIGVGPHLSSSQDLFTIEKTFFPDTDALLTDMPDFNNEMILVKGARDFELERIVKRLEERSHGTVLEVNFEALLHNLNQYRNLLSPATKLMVMVKANAYGAGILEVANFLQHQRIDQLGVAYVDEAIQLRKNGIKIPIMIMNPHIDSFSDFERFDLQAEIFSIGHLRRMIRDTKKPPPIHVKIDTGMHRLGFSPSQLDELIQVLNSNKGIEVAGIFTHFSSSDLESEDDFTKSQARIFDDSYDKLVDALGYRPTRHACNSPAMVRWPQYHYEMVRLGIGLHGFDPTSRLKLRSSSTLKSVISQIKSLKKGDTVGYSRKGIINKDSRIAVVPIGYEDGYLRIFGNGKAYMTVQGVKCPTVGNICMDMCMIDVTEVAAKEGDEVIVFGQIPSIQELATWGGTIPYEVLTNVSSRVKRVFTSE